MQTIEFKEFRDNPTYSEINSFIYERQNEPYTRFKWGNRRLSLGDTRPLMTSGFSFNYDSNCKLRIAS